MARGLVALPLVLALFLTGCGGGDSDVVSTVTQTTSVTEATTVTETVTTTVTTTETPAPDLATRSFQLPSGNIGCLLAARILRCDIGSGLDPEPTEACDFDWVGLELGRSGAAAPNCGSDTILDSGAPTLAYGSSWGRAGMVCESRRTGLRCANRQGHALTLARGSWTVS